MGLLPGSVPTHHPALALHPLKQMLVQTTLCVYLQK